MKLGDRGDKTPDLSGEGETKSRKLSTPAQIAARVAVYEDDVPLAAEGVIALNPGYFLIERMRDRKAARVRSAAAKVRG